MTKAADEIRAARRLQIFRLTHTNPTEAGDLIVSLEDRIAALPASPSTPDLVLVDREDLSSLLLGYRYAVRPAIGEVPRHHTDRISRVEALLGEHTE